MKKMNIKLMALAVSATFATGAHAFTFESDGGAIRGSLDSSISFGLGVRANSPGCNEIIGTAGGAPAQPAGAGAPNGCIDAFSGYNDQGNLNYKKGQLFTEYLKGTHELLLKLPDDYKFMARVNWVKDFASTHPSGYVSGAGATSFPGDSKRELGFKARLLDFWVSKEMELNGEHARIRVGNQVISWGESLFLPGGINQTNAMDIMRLSQPGTQLKEVMLPAPIASMATGLGGGFNVEGYVQSNWNKSYFPPVGSYWSTATVGNGASAAGIPTTSTPRNNGQWGLSLRYQPEGTQANFGLYAMNYHDKAPVLDITPANTYTYSYLSDRKMYGVSANFPVGNWAVGSELSYRPKDAVALGGACMADGKCYVEEEKYQFHLTGLLSLTPGDNGAILDFLHADTATLLAEAAVVR
ncbi:MAG TPA: DUF1302 family protein, partial [Rhodocyclaceae bacterium]|nr:DUF1302 family protein [Rhodocyclaceae bacterium]